MEVGLSKDEIERLMFFEQAKEQAEKDHAVNSKDTQALTRWGGALLELAHFRQGPEALVMIHQAIEKFKKALAIDARKHDTLWCLGNAYTSQGFLTSDSGEANVFFNQASDCFKRALKEDPMSEVYQKAIEMTAKAPQLHTELQKQLQGQNFGPGPSSSTTRKQASSDFWFDVGGWVCLAVIAVGWVALARSAAPVAAPAAAK